MPWFSLLSGWRFSQKLSVVREMTDVYPGVATLPGFALGSSAPGLLKKETWWYYAFPFFSFLWWGGPAIRRKRGTANGSQGWFLLPAGFLSRGQEPSAAERLGLVIKMYTPGCYFWYSEFFEYTCRQVQGVIRIQVWFKIIAWILLVKIVFSGPGCRHAAAAKSTLEPSAALRVNQLPCKRRDLSSILFKPMASLCQLDTR